MLLWQALILCVPVSVILLHIRKGDRHYKMAYATMQYSYQQFGGLTEKTAPAFFENRKLSRIYWVLAALEMAILLVVLYNI